MSLSKALNRKREPKPVQIDSLNPVVGYIQLTTPTLSGIVIQWVTDIAVTVVGFKAEPQCSMWLKSAVEHSSTVSVRLFFMFVLRWGPTYHHCIKDRPLTQLLCISCMGWWYRVWELGPTESADQVLLFACTHCCLFPYVTFVNPSLWWVQNSGASSWASSVSLPALCRCFETLFCRKASGTCSFCPFHQ